MDRDAVLAQIAAAFEGVSRAGGVSLREGRVIDDYGTDAERAAARLLDTDTRWQEVPAADIEHYGDALFFLDAIGLRYYLPAFMTYALRHLQEEWYGVINIVLVRLEVTVHDGKPHLEPYKLINTTQAQAIGSFLQYVAERGDEYDREDAARVFRDYWNCLP